MRKIKVALQCRVPSWNFCNLDGMQPDQRITTEACRFCVSTKAGKRCLLYDKPLKFDGKFIYKPDECIDATAGFAITVDEPVPERPVVDPKVIIRETLKLYNKELGDLLNQGYPRSMAEMIAMKYVTGDS